MRITSSTLVAEPLQLDCATPLSLGEVVARLPAGFPSPAADHAIERISLDQVLIQHPLATYVVTVKGDSMRDAGIDDGDRLLVDRAIRPAQHRHIVVAMIDGELTLKRLFKRGGVVKLEAANPTYPDIRIEAFSELVIWGVATTCIKRLS